MPRLLPAVNGCGFRGELWPMCRAEPCRSQPHRSTSAGWACRHRAHGEAAGAGGAPRPAAREGHPAQETPCAARWDGCAAWSEGENQRGCNSPAGLGALGPVPPCCTTARTSAAAGSPPAPEQCPGCRTVGLGTRPVVCSPPLVNPVSNS